MHPINGGLDSLLSISSLFLFLKVLFIQAKMSKSAYKDRDLKDQNTQINGPIKRKFKKTRDYDSKKRRFNKQTKDLTLKPIIPSLFLLPTKNKTDATLMGKYPNLSNWFALVIYIHLKERALHEKRNNKKK